VATKREEGDTENQGEEERRPEFEAETPAPPPPATPLTSLAGVGAKTIEKMEAAGINSVEKLASMTPEQLMEIPGIGEKMVDKIYQSVNRFYEGGVEGEAAGEGATSAEAVQGEAAAEAVAEGAEAEAAEEGATEAAESAETAAEASLEQEAAPAEETRVAEETHEEAAPAENEGRAGRAEEAKPE